LGPSTELKLNITDIGEVATRYQRNLDADEVQTLLRAVNIEALKDSANAEMSLEVSRAGETVTVEGLIRGDFRVKCGRCLAAAEVAVDEPNVRLTFVPAIESVLGEEGLESEDLDTFTHDGLTLDIRALLREYLVAAIPIAPLCRWDCKGICTDCGLNLNETQCGCPSRQEPANKWAAALQDIKKRGIS
jgi:uncharacterized protein